MTRVAWLLLLLTASCGPSKHRLLVDIVTDFAPVLEASGIVVRVGDDERRDLFELDDALFTPGKRVATFELSDGSYDVLVSLRGPSGTLVERRYVVRIAGSDFALTAVLTRDCVGVVCPESGQDSRATACLGGQCVPEACTATDDDGCADARECSMDRECGAANECAQPRCVVGTCVFELQTETCAAGTFCTASGCREANAPPADAGNVLDASQPSDSGTTDAEPPDDAGALLDGSGDAAEDSGAGMDAAQDTASVDSNLEDSAVEDTAIEDAGTVDTGPPATGLVEIAGSDVSTCARHTSGTVWCWGTDANGVLGNGGATPRSDRPVQVLGISNASHLDCGAGHCCAREGRRIRCWGDNRARQVPGSTSDMVSVPAEQTFSFQAVFYGLATGARHTCWMLDPSGFDNYHPFCVGANDEMQLGTSSPPHVFVSTWNRGGIAAGARHSCGYAIFGSVEVACWGSDQLGQLGTSGAPMDSGNSQTSTETSSRSGFTQITAGDDFTLFKRASGEVRFWGTLAGSTAHASQPTGVTDAIQVGAGPRHACAVRTGGAVVCWGDNAAGQTTGNSSDGTNIAGPRLVMGLPSDAVAVGAGNGHSCAVFMDGTAWCWGDNSRGQLGRGSSGGGTEPTLVVAP